MRTPPEHWSEYRENPLYETEYRLIIAGTIYDGNIIDSENLSIQRLLFKDKLSLGNVTVATLTCSILPQGAIPKMAQITAESRTVLGTQQTNWVAEGTFFIDTREELYDGWLSIVAYDDALKMEQSFLDQELEKGEWPMPMVNAVAEVATRIGVQLDTRNSIPSSYMVEYPNELTMREVMSNIAAACGGNFHITPNRTLYLCPIKLSSTPDLTIDEGEPTEFSITGDISTISKVVCIYSEDGSYYEAGDDTGFELDVSCDWATQEIANNLLAQVNGIVYVPFSMSGKIDPMLELGDTISYNGNLLYVASIYKELSEGDYATLSADGEKSINHEYPYLGTVQRSLNKKVTLGGNYFGVSISRKKGLQIQKTNGEAVSGEALFNSDVLAMRALVDGVMKDCIYFDTVSGKYKISGDVLIEGSVQSDASITDSLYAEQGDVSQLTVDRLETSDKIKRYLSQDKSAMSFIRIEGLELRFIIANVSVNENGVAETEQLENRYGSPLYWAKDISNADIVNGYPYIDDVRVYATEKNTGFPIIVYSYTESIIRQIMFIYDPLKRATYCTESFGQGAGTNAAGVTVNQGWLQKTTTEFFMKYLTEQGKEIGIKMNNSGFTDVVGMRKPTGISFSDWDKGKFYERIDGDDTRYEYNVTFDSQGHPTKITDSTGHETALYW
nr:MAG TPA: tail protein [Caudoviricetes sp.]